jgi:hypothetical protein
MPLDADAKSFSYTALPDLVAHKRVSKRLARRNARQWVPGYVQFTGFCAIVGAFGYGFGAVSTGEEFNFNGFIVGGLFGIVVGFLWAILVNETRTNNLVRELKKSRWECEIADGEFRIRDVDGTGRSIPWGLMTLEVDDPDAWAVKYGKQYMIVFRESLRSAGLEEEFRCRIPHEVPSRT